MRRMRISVLLLLAAACLSNAKAILPNSLFDRQSSTCAAANFTSCPNSGLPSDFCCGSGSSCLVLAGNTTLLCCPTSGPNGCNIIQPIPCDLSIQNNTASPGNALKTTALTGTLPKCASECCPFGFTCNSDGNCALDADQSKAPTTSSPSHPSSTSFSSSSQPPSSSPTSSSASPKTSSSAASQATETSSPSSTNTTNPVAIKVGSCDKFPAVAVLAGFFPGLALGVLLALGSICLLGARRRKAACRHSGSSFGNISDPQPTGGEMRTDFLRKPPPTPSSTAGSTPGRSNTVRRVRSLFRKSTSTQGSHSTRGTRVAPPIPLMAQRGEGGLPNQRRPVTPPLQREPSYENINIFADGDTASALRERERQNKMRGDSPTLRNNRDTNQTTFSDMMEQSGLAGLQKGQPYVYKGSEGNYTSPARPKRGATP